MCKSIGPWISPLTSSHPPSIPSVTSPPNVNNTSTPTALPHWCVAVPGARCCCVCAIWNLWINNGWVISALQCHEDYPLSLANPASQACHGSVHGKITAWSQGLQWIHATNNHKPSELGNFPKSQKSRMIMNKDEPVKAKSMAISQNHKHHE